MGILKKIFGGKKRAEQRELEELQSSMRQYNLLEQKRFAQNKEEAGHRADEKYKELIIQDTLGAFCALSVDMAKNVQNKENYVADPPEHLDFRKGRKQNYEPEQEEQGTNEGLSSEKEQQL